MHDETKYNLKSMNWQTVKKVEMVKTAVPVLHEAKWPLETMKV
jgi:hypothetical protein